MRAVLVVQVDNTTPIILNHEKSVTPGILGTTGLWQFTREDEAKGKKPDLPDLPTQGPVKIAK